MGGAILQTVHAAWDESVDGSPDDVRDARTGRADADEMDALAAKYAHRVAFFARRIERRFGLADVWRDDLESAGYWGLFKAIENRRPDAHERELSAYVSQRVEGAIFDEARRLAARREDLVDAELADLDDGMHRRAAEGEPWSPPEAEDPESRADRLGRLRLVDESLSALAQEERRLLLDYVSGRSVAEMARAGETPPSRLQSRLDRSIRLVRARSPELRRLLRYEL